MSRNAHFLLLLRRGVVCERHIAFRTAYERGAASWAAFSVTEQQRIVMRSRQSLCCAVTAAWYFFNVLPITGRSGFTTDKTLILDKCFLRFGYWRTRYYNITLRVTHTSLTTRFSWKRIPCNWRCLTRMSIVVYRKPDCDRFESRGKTESSK